MTPSRRRRPLATWPLATWPLATRLLAAQLLVVATGTATAWAVGTVAGPPLFHRHLMLAGAGPASAQLEHAERAFRSASVISLAVALLAALAAALVVGAVVARRIGGSVASAARAATGVATGRYDVRMASPGIGPEFDDLAMAFNTMARRLETVEATRRRMLADLAHELRTPVATLDAYLEGVEDGVATLDRDTVAMLRTQTGRLARLCNDIAAVSRAEEHQVELDRAPVAAAELVRAAVAGAAERYHGKGVRLTARLAEHLPLALVDADRIGQVLANLLDNAVRHTPSGGEVSLSVAAAADRRWLLVTVTDTGEGIAAEHLPHVFERFYRADAARDRAHGGSGIGLAIVRALVEAHGGWIAARSAGAGAGTAFRFTIPAVRRGRAAAAGPGQPGTEAVG